MEPIAFSASRNSLIQIILYYWMFIRNPRRMDAGSNIFIRLGGGQAVNFSSCSGWVMVRLEPLMVIQWSRRN